MTHAEVQKWVGDVVALERHIEKALEEQTKINTVDGGKLSGVIHTFLERVKTSRSAAESLQSGDEEITENPLTRAGADILGKAAGVVDRLRGESISKAIRDDYTAFNHAAIAHAMLLATAKAVGDDRVAEFARTGLRTYASLVMEVNNVIGDAVLYDLERDSNATNVDITVADSVRSDIDAAWKAEADS